MSSTHPHRSIAVLTTVLTSLSLLFSVVALLQYVWMRDLQSRYDDSERTLSLLETMCNMNAVPVMLENMMDIDEDELDHLSFSSANQKRDSARDTRALSGSLQQTLTDTMLAQEKVLMAKCLNNSKLCIPGMKGSMGDKGDIGIPGQPGSSGRQGQTGPKGDIGLQGVNGTKGHAADRGSPGISGKQGLKGPAGHKGDRGLQGDTGATGHRGLHGPVGEPGLRGDNGTIGHRGANGTAGLHGVKGSVGLPGPKGDVGLQGPAGPPAVLLNKDKNCMCLKTPTIDVFEPSNPSQSIGSTLSMKCHSNSSGAPITTTWTTPSPSNCPNSHIRNVSDFQISHLMPSQVGTYTCSVTNQFGTTTKKLTLSANLTGALDCDFEDPCPWHNVKSGSADRGWESYSGPGKINTGPPKGHDHTLASSKGTYMCVNRDVHSAGSVQEYESPELPPDGGSCLIFWYNMNGVDVGSLTVRTQTCTGDYHSILTLTGNQGPDWHQAQLQLPAFSKDHTISFRSVRGNGPKSDIAIDDIEYYTGKCRTNLNLVGPRDVNIVQTVNTPLVLDCSVNGNPPPSFVWRKQSGSCRNYNTTGELLTVNRRTSIGDAGTYVCTASNGPNSSVTKTFHVTVNSTYSGGHLPVADHCIFDHGDMCGWTQDSADAFNWDLIAGPTSSKDTGPDADHTLKNAAGKYLFIEASSPRKPGDDAILRSHVMPGNHSACLSFYYNMYSTDGMGDLEIYAENQCTHKRILLFSKSGNQGRAWIQGKASVNGSDVPTDYNLLIKAVVGSSFHSDIAIDDLLITEGSCKVVQADCDFDNGNTCLWNQSSSDDMDWTRLTSTTPSRDTGPSGDHTKNGTGKYLYMEATSTTDGDMADLVSPTMPAKTQLCLRFATSMVGIEMGSIDVKIQPVGSGTTSQSRYHRVGEHKTPEWQMATVNIPPQLHDFHIHIQGSVGPGFHSDMAIDDITVTNETC